MSRGVNKVILVGNLGSDPESRHIPSSGNLVVNVSIATSETWRDKATGEQKERTEWHRVAFFGKLAEIAAEYLLKGSQVYVEGKLRTRSWEKDGETRYATEVIADEMKMLGGRPGSESRPGNSGSSSRDYARQTGRESGGYDRPARESRGGGGPPPSDGFGDDDIPLAPHEAGSLA